MATITLKDNTYNVITNGWMKDGVRLTIDILVDDYTLTDIDSAFADNYNLDLNDSDFIYHAVGYTKVESVALHHEYTVDDQTVADIYRIVLEQPSIYDRVENCEDALVELASLIV